ncbi:MAG: class I SAM-dependent methyltransferase [Geobacteraceae bacterium]
MQTDEPVWLAEAYQSAINSCDTGILKRNIELRDSVLTIINSFFNPAGLYLDNAGGYGILTRLMRDVGLDYYWSDKYATNIFAQGFEYGGQQPVELVTAFEVLEHLVDPLADLSPVFSISRNVLFTTKLLPSPLPAPHEWWYYGTEHGQHISFYTPTSLELVAENFGLNYYNYGDIHLMTDKNISAWKFRLIMKYSKKIKLFRRLQKQLDSKTMDDMHHNISLNKNKTE